MMQALAKDPIDEFDDERRELAHRLHSTASQQLAALQLNLSLISTASPEGAEQALKDSRELAHACAREIRAITGRLHPPLLDEAGLVAAVNAMCAEIDVSLTSELPEKLKLPPRLAIGAFRIIEGLVSGGADNNVVLRLESGGICMIISGTGERDGRPVEPRIQQLGGRHSIARTGNVEMVRIWLPLTSAES